MGNLTTLANVKTLLQIPSAVTTQDALLNLIIGSVSAQIEAYCSRVFGVASYTENLSPSLTTVLQLQNWPINSVTSVTDQGSLLTVNVDYFLYSQFIASGQIYREPGWFGPMLARGLTYDPVAPMITLAVVYSAGYVLPGDFPVAGDQALPSSIELAAMQMTAKVYELSNSGNLGENLNSYKEGGIAYSFDNPAKIPADMFGLIAGMPVQFATLLNPYRRWASA